MNKYTKQVSAVLSSALMLTTLSACSLLPGGDSTPTDDAGPAPTGNFRGEGNSDYAYDKTKSKKTTEPASQNVTYDLTNEYDYIITSNISSINQYSGKISSENNTDGRDVKNLEIKPAGLYKITFKSASDENKTLEYAVYNNDSIKDKGNVDSNDSALVNLEDGVTLFIKGTQGTLTMTTVNDACDVDSACSITNANNDADKNGKTTNDSDKTKTDTSSSATNDNNKQ